MHWYCWWQVFLLQQITQTLQQLFVYFLTKLSTSVIPSKPLGLILIIALSYLSSHQIFQKVALLLGSNGICPVQPIFEELVAIDRCNMNCMVLRVHIMNALTMVNEKGRKWLNEPFWVNQMVVILLSDWLFMTVARIAIEDAHKVTFSRGRGNHGEMKKVQTMRFVTMDPLLTSMCWSVEVGPTFESWR